MSGSTTLKHFNEKLRFYGLILGFALVAFWTSSTKNNEPEPNRAIASTPHHVHHKHHDHKSHGGKKHLTAVHKVFDLNKKAANPLQVLLVGPVDGTKSGESFTVTAKLKMNSPAENVSIKWSLPKGVTVVKGAESEVLGKFSSGEEKEIEIELSTNTDENLKIHALVTGSFGNSRLSRSSQFNTQLQGTINRGKEQLAQRTKDYVGK